MFEWIRNIFNKDDNRRIKIRFELDNGNYYEELVKADDFDQRLIELEKELNPRKPLSEIEFIWCLIGNIINEHYSEKEDKIEHGTKHFSPNTKVYCFPVQWGDGYENIRVIGRHRKTSRNICIIMRSRYITNWRLQKVYRPYILKVMHSQKGWTDNDHDKETILEMVKGLSDRTKEMERG